MPFHPALVRTASRASYETVNSMLSDLPSSGAAFVSPSSRSLESPARQHLIPGPAARHRATAPRCRRASEDPLKPALLPGDVPF